MVELTLNQSNDMLHIQAFNVINSQPKFNLTMTGVPLRNLLETCKYNLKSVTGKISILDNQIIVKGKPTSPPPKAKEPSPIKVKSVENNEISIVERNYNVPNSPMKARHLIDDDKYLN